MDSILKMLEDPTGLFENPHERFMRAAIQEAEQAYEEDEVPVGAVVVAHGRIIARAYNQTERLNDATAHAEMLALTSAESHFGCKVLEACTLYVTLEPCLMCAGACYWTRIGRIVVGARDPKRGFLTYQQPEGRSMLHPKTEYMDGIMAEECGDLLSRYFHSKRKT